MVVSKIVRMFSFQPPVPVSAIPTLILSSKPEEEDYAADAGHPQHSQTHSIPCWIIGRLGSNKNVASGNAAEVTEADYHCGTNRPRKGSVGVLVVSPYITTYLL
jgi:hypothetical protein